MTIAAPGSIVNDFLRFEPLHAAITAALLLAGWRGSQIARSLAGLSVALGLAYLAPVVWMAGLLVLPAVEENDRSKIMTGLVCFGVLVAFYGTAMAVMRRANPAARHALKTP
jgi:hypothetical protein